MKPRRIDNDMLDVVVERFLSEPLNESTCHAIPPIVVDPILTKWSDGFEIYNCRQQLCWG